MLAYLSTRLFFRLDLTELNQYSISQSTKATLEELDDLVNVRVYFSKNLPPQFSVIDEYVRDILSEYSAYGSDNLNVRYLDPAKEDVATEARSYGIPEIQMDVISDDQRQIQNGHLGLAILYGDKVEVLPVIQNIANLEYDLTSAIKKVRADQARTVGFLTGHGEGDEMLYQAFYKTLSKNYAIGSVDLELENALTGLDTLIIPGPKQFLPDAHLLAIDQFMLSGGKVIFLVDQIQIGENLSALPVDHNVDDFLEHFGVKVEEALVMDASNQQASFNQGFITYSVPYPHWIKLMAQYFNVDSPVVNQLDSIVLLWSSPLNLKGKEGLQIETLASSTERSVIQKDSYDLNPQGASVPTEPAPSLPMIAMVSGDSDSYFKDSDIEKPEGFLETSSVPLHFMVVGNSRLIEDGTLGHSPQNLNFMMNAVDFLTLDESLISIRSKTLKQRPVKEFSDAGRGLVKFFAIYFVPLLVVFFGVMRAYWLKKMRSMKF